MSRFKGTPGKWDVHESFTLEIHPLDDEDGLNIIAEIPADAPQDYNTKKANAQAIACLPELVEACELLVKWGTTHGGPKAPIAAYNAAKQVLNKIEGKE